MIASLKTVLGPDANIRTVAVDVEKPRYGEYNADNTIEVEIHDPAMLGRAVDAATKTGATLRSGIELSAAQEEQVRAEALKQATTRARANGEAMAAALGLRVLRVVSVDTSAAPPITPELSGSIQMGVLEKKTARQPVPMPIENGAAEIRAQVTMILEVGP